MRIQVDGEWQPRVGAKDLVLAVASQISASGADYLSVEWTGSAIRKLSVDGRFTLCNMSAELGAKNGYVPPDETAALWLDEQVVLMGGAGVPPAREMAGETPAPPGDTDTCPTRFSQWHTDDNAAIKDAVQVDVTALEPQVACPHRVDNVKPVGEVAGTRVHQCLLGTCTNGRLSDLEAAWHVLEGHHVHPSTRLLVFPASQRVNTAAIKNGLAEQFIAAGAVWMNPGCGPCLGAHEGALAPGEVCISTANRNFKGRMGTPESDIYLASPESVAAAAITGEITDPREVS
jgi:3-isopropylmalate/(R)-2-methylmalate dehydratase large subunit